MTDINRDDIDTCIQVGDKPSGKGWSLRTDNEGQQFWIKHKLANQLMYNEFTVVESNTMRQLPSWIRHRQIQFKKYRFRKPCVGCCKEVSFLWTYVKHQEEYCIKCAKPMIPCTRDNLRQQVNK